MNARLETLAHERKELANRSALQRLRLRKDARNVRESLHWRRTAGAPTSAPVVRRIVLGLALSFVGADRAARTLMLAGRIVLVAKIAAFLVHYARQRAA